MKKIILLLFLCSALAAQAQNYKPLHDSVYLQFQLKNLPFGYSPNFAHFYPTFEAKSGNDSIFNIHGNCTDYYMANWPLGRDFIKFLTPHRYAFVDIQDDTCYIHTDYQLGTTWNYNTTNTASGGITAKFVDKVLYNFSGVSDSAIVIQLSTGDTIRVSKHYGICSFRQLFSINSPVCCGEDTITLVSMSNTPVQQPVYKPLEVFNYTTGETLYYKDENYTWTWNPGPTATVTRNAIKLVVMNKSTSADTVYYDFNWYSGLQFQNGPYSFRLKITTEEALLISGTTFFPELDVAFAPTQCGINYFSLSGSSMNIYKEHDQSTDDDYKYSWGDEQGQSNQYWYDTDHGFFQYKYTQLEYLRHITELVARYAPGTPDTDNLYLTGTVDQHMNSFRMYPVPCTTQLTIEGISIQDMSIELSSVSGTIISSNQYSVFSGNSISTYNLKPGMYILYLKNDAGVMTRMFIKE